MGCDAVVCRCGAIRGPSRADTGDCMTRSWSVKEIELDETSFRSNRGNKEIVSNIHKRYHI